MQDGVRAASQWSNVEGRDNVVFAQGKAARRQGTMGPIAGRGLAGSTVGH
jgi:hypothetical protein